MPKKKPRLNAQQRAAARVEARFEEDRIKEEMTPQRAATRQRISERMRLTMSAGIAVRDLRREIDSQFTEINFQLAEIKRLLTKEPA
jgi:hypothetical protein